MFEINTKKLCHKTDYINERHQGNDATGAQKGSEGPGGWRGFPEEVELVLGL